jgi:hypothetical protein
VTGRTAPPGAGGPREPHRRPAERHRDLFDRGERGDGEDDGDDGDAP